MTARAMVLCAGLGTRLRPLTEELPKPLVPIGDRSIFAHAVRALRGAGIAEVVINTHHLPDAFNNAIIDLQIEAHVVHEPEIRGTAGGIAGARALLGPAPVLIWNGDIWIDPPIAELSSWDGAGLCLLVAPREVGAGSVGLDASGQVVRLRGEVFAEEASGGDYVGVAMLGERCLATLPERGCLIGDWALPALRRGEAIRTLPHAGPWSDAGDLASYLEANQRWIAANAWGDSWIADDAEVDAGVEVSASVIGRGARVAGPGRVERSVIWPGAVARAPLSDAVVTRAGRVVSL